MALDKDALPTYRNIKNKKVYRVLGTARNCTNAVDGQEMVVYIAGKTNTMFVREMSEFDKKFEKIESPLLRRVPREIAASR